MPLERESPDRSLRSERIRADQAVVNRDDFLAIVAHDLHDLQTCTTFTTCWAAKSRRRGLTESRR